uniref:Uncharacterized protein n=1 Tax=Tetranychus urticae TaxID=32264 RepID=T1JWV3_TETUR
MLPLSSRRLFDQHLIVKNQAYNMNWTNKQNYYRIHQFLSDVIQCNIHC